MKNSLRISLVQFSPLIGNIKFNLRKASDFINMASEQGSEVVLFPELFLSGYSEPNIMKHLAETVDGESMEFLKTAATKSKIAIAGSFLEWDPLKQKIYNTAFFVGSNGQILGDFQKIHLFGQEKEYITPGKKLVSFKYQEVTYGFALCFDIEFPEVARFLALQGLQVLLVPSANMVPYGPFHRNYSLARAQENHVFVAYCNQTGSNGVYDFVGESCLVNPFGDIICQISREEKLVTGIIDLTDINRSQKSYNYLKERKCFFNTTVC